MAPAFAQDASPGGGGRHRKGQQTTDTATPKVKADDKAYKAALDRVPASTQKYDPWGTMRPTSDKPNDKH